MADKNSIQKYTDKEALDFHTEGKPGKIEVISSKNLSTQRDLTLAQTLAPLAKIPYLERKETTRFVHSGVVRQNRRRVRAFS